MNPLNNKRFKNQDRGFYKNQPVFKNVIDFYNKLTEEKEQIEFNDKFKRMSMFYYKYYRNVVRGIIAKEINNNYQVINSWIVNIHIARGDILWKYIPYHN